MVVTLFQDATAHGVVAQPRVPLPNQAAGVDAHVAVIDPRTDHGFAAGSDRRPHLDKGRVEAEAVVEYR